MKQEQLSNLPIEWKRGGGLSKSDLYEDGKNKCILYGELYTKHKKVLIESSSISRTNKIGAVCSKKGDILIPGTSTASKKDMLLAREIDEDGVFLGGDINIIRPSKGLFAKKYLPYYFETFTAYDQLDRYITGATGIIHISNSGIKNLKVPLPSIQEQQRIVSILDEAFAAIATAKANAEQNLKNAKELFESYLQGVFDPSTRSGQGKKGDGWEEKKLGEVSKINYGYTEKASIEKIGPKFLRITDIQENSVNWETVPYCKCSEKEFPKYKLETGDIVFARTGATTGKSYLIKNPPNSVFASYLIRLRMNSIKEFIPEFISYFFQTKTYWDKINAGISGSAQGGFNATKLGELKFYFPKSKEEQKNIVRQLDALRAETQKLEAVYHKKLQDLEELKKSVLQKAFAGELRSPEGAASANDGYSPSEKKTKNKISPERA